MPLFDTYVMVDWSGGNRRRGGRTDCIWIAHGGDTSSAPATESPRSRTEAEQVLRSILRADLAAGAHRVLVAADFAYGYPRGFASLLPAADEGAPAWQVVWQY